jgi:hypothetical protein
VERSAWIASSDSRRSSKLAREGEGGRREMEEMGERD